jgi:predicted DNA-binding WGR domain protein
MVKTFVTYAKLGVPVEIMWDAISKQYFGGRKLTENEKRDIMAKIKGAASNLPQGSTYNMLSAWMAVGRAISKREAYKITEYRNEAATILRQSLVDEFSQKYGLSLGKEKGVIDTLLTSLQGKSLTTENVAQAILTLQETYGEDVTRSIVTGMGGIEGIKNVMMGYQAFMVAPTVLGQLAKETGMKAQELGRITSTGTPEDVIELVTKKFESAPAKRRALNELVNELRRKGYSEEVIRRTVLETAERYMERSVPQYLEQPLPGEEKLVGAPQWGQLSDTLDKLIKDLTELQNVTKGIKDSNIKREEKKG